MSATVKGIGKEIHTGLISKFSPLKCKTFWTIFWIQFEWVFTKDWFLKAILLWDKGFRVQVQLEESSKIGFPLLVSAARVGR